jgi:hypothetical protein
MSNSIVTDNTEKQLINPITGQLYKIMKESKDIDYLPLVNPASPSCFLLPFSFSSSCFFLLSSSLFDWHFVEGYRCDFRPK